MQQERERSTRRRGTRAAASASCSRRSATSPPTRTRTKRRQSSSAVKIAEIVKDPETARKLTPTDLYARRPLCDSGYYETFNRPNVTLVSIEENPIANVTEKGIVTEDGTLHELDVLVCATGFDAVDGNYVRVDIRGRDGESPEEHWSEAARRATSAWPPQASPTCS